MHASASGSLMFSRRSSYYWANIRCGVRPVLNANHEEELKEAAKKFAEDNKISAVLVNPLMPLPLKWHSLWTAPVPDFIAQYHQVEHDDDFVYLLSFGTKGEQNEE